MHMVTSPYGAFYIWYMLPTYGIEYMWNRVHMVQSTYGTEYIWYIVRVVRGTYGT